ncbi:MAG: zinc ribbon domain-containing protein [Ktedonobacteraceae bacterium]|nr:zinc ribbon domain-containing protein [Ktedonobacteraceae bacterium]
MNTPPWKQQRIIELPRSQRHTEPLHTIVHRVHCGTSYTTNDVFCGMCGAPLWKEEVSNEYTTVSFGLTVPSWQRG